MARMNLSIPDDVKAEMDRLTNVNWSLEATNTFRTIVFRSNTKVIDMTTIKARLADSKQRFDTEEREAGEDLGRTWAAEAAEYEDLLRLRGLGDNAPDTLAELSMGVSGDDTFDEFVEAVFGDEGVGLHDNPAFCSGFFAGAKAVFEEAMG